MTTLTLVPEEDEAALCVLDISACISGALERLRHIEATTPYRLGRSRTGELYFAAPRIYLDASPKK